jgi:hypothetical protein
VRQVDPPHAAFAEQGLDLKVIDVPPDERIAPGGLGLDRRAFGIVRRCGKSSPSARYFTDGFGF